METPILFACKWNYYHNLPIIQRVVRRYPGALHLVKQTGQGGINGSMSSTGVEPVDETTETGCTKIGHLGILGTSSELPRNRP